MEPAMSSPLPPLTRRDFLRRSGVGLGMLGLSDLLAESGGAVRQAPVRTSHPKRNA
jgi:hypothetical protein